MKAGTIGELISSRSEVSASYSEVVKSPHLDTNIQVKKAAPPAMAILPRKIKILETTETNPIRKRFEIIVMKACLADAQNALPLMAIMMYARRVINFRIFSKHHRTHATTLKRIFKHLF